MSEERDRMKRDWDDRARQSSRYFIATGEPDDDETAFDESGRRDVMYFFEGLEHLLAADATVLDIGCGIGRMDRHVAPRVGRLIGIDVSGEMVRQCRERLSDLPNTLFLEGDGWSLAPIASASIDLVFSHIVFQHLPRAATRGYFREALRVLRPGGHFVFRCPRRTRTPRRIRPRRTPSRCASTRRTT
jgi:SAM-dependent methyltransferase